MKRFFLALVLIGIAALSCKKQHDNDNINKPDTGEHKVTFNVGFSQQTTDFTTNGLKVNSTTHSLATTALADQVDVLYLSVYNSEGLRLHIIKQVSTDSGFGSLTDNLTTGTYTIVIAAGKTGLELTNDIILGSKGSPNTFITTSSLNTDVISYGGLAPVLFNKDAFYKKLTVTVPGTVSQNVSLDRITARVKVIIEDAIPANATAVQLTVSPIPYKFYIGTAQVTTEAVGNFIFKSTLLPADIGTTNYTFTTTPFLPFAITTQYIESFSASGTISAFTLREVYCSANKTTVLTGNLFGGAGNPATNGFHMVTDTSWNNTPINKPF